MHSLEIPEIAKLLRALRERKDPQSQIHHLAALTLFVTGTRVGQLRQIRGEDIFQKDGQWVVWLRSAKRGNERIRNLRIDADPAFDMTPLIEIAKLRGTSLIFGTLTRQYLNKILKEAAAAAGIHTAFGHTHIFRHSVAMAIWKQTLRLGAITEFLGHRSATTALCYLKENDNRLGQSAVDALVLA